MNKEQKYCSQCGYVPASECSVQYMVGLMHHCGQIDENTYRSASAYDSKEQFERLKAMNIKAIARRKKRESTRTT